MITVFLVLYFKQGSRVTIKRSDFSVFKDLACIVICDLRILDLIGVIRKKDPEIQQVCFDLLNVTIVSFQHIINISLHLSSKRKQEG